MPDIEPLGDRALTIRLGDRMDAGLAALARGLAARLRGISGVREAVPAYATVTVFYEADYAFNAFGGRASDSDGERGASRRSGARHTGAL